MNTNESQEVSSVLIAFLPVLPSVFFGLILVWQQGTSMMSVSFAFLMVLFTIVTGFFIWTWHNDHIDKLKSYHQKKFKEGLNALTVYAAELERLLLTAEANLADQVKTAKDMSEQESAQLKSNLTSLNDTYNQLFNITHPPEAGQKSPTLDEFNNNLDKLHKELDAILQPLQVQSKSSQILTLVLTNLATIKETLEEARQQDTQSKKKMLNVDTMMTSFQTQFESVKRDKQSSAK
jgi:uncharacterized membrane protein (DUF106 family)